VHSPTLDNGSQGPSPVQLPASLPASLPADVADWLSRVSAALVRSFAGDLRSLILFGSAAEGRMRASSDVNLLVVLDRLDVDRFNGVAELIQAASAAVELHPMFMLFSELPLATEAFAVKFDDIAHRHVLLYGVEPFGDLVVARAILIGRVQQVLLNLTLRARTVYVVNHNREEVLLVAVADAAAPLRRSAQAILELRGKQSASPKESLEILAAELGSWSEDLKNLTRARQELQLPAGMAGPLLLRLAALAEAMQGPVAALRQ
jgi:predicted nucleotidyltransferase